VRAFWLLLRSWQGLALAQLTRYATEIVALLCLSGLSFYIIQDFSQMLVDQVEAWPKILFIMRFYLMVFLAYLGSLLFGKDFQSLTGFFRLYGEYPRAIYIVALIDNAIRLVLFVTMVVFLSVFVLPDDGLFVDLGLFVGLSGIFIINSFLQMGIMPTKYFLYLSQSLLGPPRILFFIAVLFFWYLVLSTGERHVFFTIGASLLASFSLLATVADNAQLMWLERQHGISQEFKEKQLLIAGMILAVLFCIATGSFTPHEIALILIPFLLTPFLIFQIHPSHFPLNALILFFASVLSQSLIMIDKRFLILFVVVLYLMRIQQKNLFYRS
jgi:hypothetical protein